jgi:hypothetical protein
MFMLISQFIPTAIFFGGSVSSVPDDLLPFQHYILRVMLWRNGFAPLRYVPFLNYAADLLFLRKIGGGYMFIHRMVLEHFAALEITHHKA